MRSTIREARARLDDLAETLNPAMYGRLKSEVDEAAKEARERAERFYGRQLDQLDVERQELLREACEVRDSYEVLADEASLGRLSAGEYGERLERLNARRDRVEAGLAEMDRQTERLGGIEDDPEAWADSLYRRTPSTAPHFSF